VKNEGLNLLAGKGKQIKGKLGKSAAFCYKATVTPMAGGLSRRVFLTRRDANRINSGRHVGFQISPSIGSIVSSLRERAMDGVPACVGVGYSNATRGPGFFNAKRDLSRIRST
jgi:hypothetical protein